MQRSKLSAAKFVVAVALSASMIAPPPAQAQWVVIDPTNLIENMITALEEVAQTMKQIEEYRLQLEQYQNQVQNTLNPAIFAWDEAQATINGLMEKVDSLSYYKNLAGSIDAYAAKYQDVGYYRLKSCFTSSGCSLAEWKLMRASETMGSEARKKANDALLRGLDRQQDSLKADANKLQSLQASTQSSSGQMQALQAANQLASHQSNQLLQIRGILLAQHAAEVTRSAAANDRKAKEQAAADQVREGTFVKSPGRSW